jgi:hypothetical protein
MNKWQWAALTLCLGLLSARQSSASCTATASYQCYGRGTLSCSGASVCSSGPTWVQCDGVRTDCPACAVEVDCTWICPPGLRASAYCSSDFGRCTENFKSVQCDSAPRIYCSASMCY